MKRWFNTTSKIVVWFVLINSEIQIYLSYFLAYLGRTEVLELMGKAIVTEVVASVALLVIKAVIENVFEKNEIFPLRSSNSERDLDDPSGNSPTI